MVVSERPPNVIGGPEERPGDVPVKEYRADWQEMIKNENLQEAELQHIDNGLWRDTKNEVAIYNAKEATDI